MNDVDKQPGIRFHDVMLISEHFERKLDVPQKLKTDIEFGFNSYQQEDKHIAELSTTLSCLSEGNESVITLKCIHVGIFSIIREYENMDIQEYIETNAVSLMFPFIREHIYTITQKSGISPIALPPMNVIAMIKNKTIEINTD